tara:strand:- start:393 stop:569 length:177 start_codon:yes stop_codon:yes gene_type:complete
VEAAEAAEAAEGMALAAEAAEARERAVAMAWVAAGTTAVTLAACSAARKGSAADAVGQ